MNNPSHLFTLGHLLRERRIALNKTMREVAGESLSPTAVNNIEKGKIKPSMDTMFYLCQALQLSPERILLYYPDFSKSCPVLLRIVDEWLLADRIDESITLLYDLYWVATETTEQEALLFEIQTRIGLAFGQAGCYENARRVMRDTYNYYQQTKNIPKQITILNYIGRFLLAERQLNIALSSYKQAIALAERYALQGTSIGDTYLNLAHAYQEAHNWREAHYYCQKASSTFQIFSDANGTARCLLLQAEILSAQGETTQAFQLGCRAYRHFTQTAHRKWTAQALSVLGDILHVRRKFSLAKECYRQSAELTSQTSPRELYVLDRKQAQLALTQQDVASARHYAKAALEKVKQPRPQSQIYHLLAQCDLLEGKVGGYTTYMDAATEAMQKSGDGYAAALLQCELADETDDWERMRSATRLLRNNYSNYWIG